MHLMLRLQKHIRSYPYTVAICVFCEWTRFDTSITTGATRTLIAALPMGLYLSYHSPHKHFVLFCLASVYFKNVIIARFICHDLTRWAIYHHTDGKTPNRVWLRIPARRRCTCFNYFKLNSRAISDPVAYFEVSRFDLHVMILSLHHSVVNCTSCKF